MIDILMPSRLGAGMNAVVVVVVVVDDVVKEFVELLLVVVDDDVGAVVVVVSSVDVFVALTVAKFATSMIMVASRTIVVDGKQPKMGSQGSIIS